MSSPAEEALGLILKELRDIRGRLDSIEQDLSGLRIAVVEHTREEEGRFERLEASLSAHASRLGNIERSLMNGGSR